jgi:hypothetical protein
MGARYAFLPLFLIALVFIAASPINWLLTEIPPMRDAVAIDYENAYLYQKTYPFHDYAAGQVLQGDLPLWNPRLHCGTPFLADFTNGVFQPLNAVFLAMPTSRALAVHAFVSMCLSGIGLALFCRALGLSYPASVVGGVAFAYSGAVLAASTNPALAATVAWTPLAFWGLREFKNSARLVHAVLVGTACAMMILAGGWSLAMVTLAFLALYALVLLYQNSKDLPLPRLKAVAVGIAVALGLSAVQWAPSLPWLLERAQPWEALWRTELAAQTPADLRSLLRQMLTSQTGTLPGLAYVGIPVLLLAPAGLFHQGRRRDVLFFAVTTPVAFWLVLILSASPASVIDGRVFVYPAILGLSVLAAMGTHRMLAGRRGNPVWWVGLLTVAVGTLLFLLSEPLARSTIIVFIALLAPALLFRNRITAFVAAFGVIFLLFFDLTSTNANKFMHPFQDAPECYTVYDGLLARAEEYALGARAIVTTHPLNKALPKNLPMVSVYSLDSASGALVPLTVDQETWRQRLTQSDAPAAGRRRLLDAMAVRAVITDHSGALDPAVYTDFDGALTEAGTENGVRLLVNHEARSRCFFVAEWTPVDGASGALTVLTGADFDVAGMATVDLNFGGIESLVRTERHVPGAPPPEESPVEINTAPLSLGVTTRGAAPGTSGLIAPLPENTCAIRSALANSVVLEVNAGGPGIAVLADTHAPGWSATLDGHPAPILRVNGLFRGIATPAGHHIITFTYRPAGFYAGAVISLLTLTLLALMGVHVLWRSGSGP